MSKPDRLSVSDGAEQRDVRRWRPPAHAESVAVGDDGAAARQGPADRLRVHQCVVRKAPDQRHLSVVKPNVAPHGVHEVADRELGQAARGHLKQRCRLPLLITQAHQCRGTIKPVEGQRWQIFPTFEPGAFVGTQLRSIELPQQGLRIFTTGDQSLQRLGGRVQQPRPESQCRAARLDPDDVTIVHDDECATQALLARPLRNPG